MTLTQTGEVCGFIPSCDLSVALADDLDGTNFLLGEGDTAVFDFLRFEGNYFNFAATGGISFDITATLAFSSPKASVTSEGEGGAIFLFGSITGGELSWDDVPETVVVDGNEFEVDFLGSDFTLLLDGDTGVTTTASVTANSTAPVPLPASALFLFAGVGGLAAMRRHAA